MRRQLFMALLTLIMGIVLCFGFVACDNGRTPPTPTKLGNVRARELFYALKKDGKL